MDLVGHRKKITSTNNPIADLPRNEIIGETDLASIKEASKDSVRAIMLIRAYRIRGHLIANLDPLSIQKKKNIQNLSQRLMVLRKKITIEKYF